jgi:hypothetical protein
VVEAVAAGKRGAAAAVAVLNKVAVAAVRGVPAAAQMGVGLGVRVTLVTLVKSRMWAWIRVKYAHLRRKGLPWNQKGCLAETRKPGAAAAVVWKVMEVTQQAAALAAVAAAARRAMTRRECKLAERRG